MMIQWLCLMCSCYSILPCCRCLCTSVSYCVCNCCYFLFLLFVSVVPSLCMSFIFMLLDALPFVLCIQYIAGLLSFLCIFTLYVNWLTCYDCICVEYNVCVGVR